jgi:hypothetical protein
MILKNNLLETFNEDDIHEEETYDEFIENMTNANLWDRALLPAEFICKANKWDI